MSSCSNTTPREHRQQISVSIAALDRARNVMGAGGIKLPGRMCPGEEAERRYAVLPPITWTEFAALLDNGIGAPALIWPDLPARAAVVFRDNRPLFDFASDAGVDSTDDASLALVFLALDEGGEAADLVAWASGTNHIAAWFGEATLLGSERLLLPRLYDPLQVFPDPLAWLKAGRNGVVVVNPAKAWRLPEGETLAVGDIEFGERLAALLQPPAPKIFVKGDAL
jgi:hypothetical protein